LIGELGAAMVRGYQIDDEGRELEGPECVLACCKHFAGYSETQGGRDATEAEISRRKLMTTFLPPFHAACKAGAATFMTAYMAVDGVPCTQNQWLLRKVLRDDWGFKGVLISDYDNVSRLVNEHFVCSSNYEAAIRTVVSGNDMMMGTSHFFENATQAVQKGDLDPKLIDEACRRILRLKFKLGLFENRFLNTKDYEPGSAVGRDEHKKLAFECAAESVVLLKNENVLPLQAQKLKKVVVIGPSADNVQDQLGDWVCGGRWATKELPPRGNVSTVLDGIRKYCPEVTHHQGCSMLGDPMDTETIAEAVQLATTADLIVLALGDPMRWNGEQRDRANLDLPGRQQELMEAISKTGKLVVLVLVLGRPNTVPWAAEHLPAILAAFNPGQGGGEAIASIIFGDTNPSGKLTISWPRHVGQLPVFYNYLPGWHAKRYIDMTPKPQWAFGHGLSFSTFAFSHLKLSSDASSSPERTDNSTPTPERRDETTLKVGDTLNVKFNIENTGSRVGTETAMVFVHDVVASVTVPVKELKGFARVELRAGEKKEVCVAIPVERLSIVTPDLERIVEAGEFRIMVGPASDMLPLTGVLHVTK
jgi:beta-glucosidase